MTYRVVNNLTGAEFVGDDLRRALYMVLSDHSQDEDVEVAIDALADAAVRGDRLLNDVWAAALNVTITCVFPRQR